MNIENINNNTTAIAQEVNAEKALHLSELVAEEGCQARGTEEICRDCARLSLQLIMCLQVKQDQ
jgi:hypothetical protein